MRFLPRKTLVTFLIILGAFVASFLTIALIMLALGIDPIQAHLGMFRAAFGSRYQVSVTINKTLPRLIAALGIAYALRGGLWNIGAEGQIYIGAMAASLLALHLPGFSQPVNVVLALAAGFVAGGLWGAIPGLLRAYRGINEIITTLLSVYIAIELNNFLVQIVLKPLNATFPASALFPKDWRLPIILKGTILHAGVLVGILAVVVVAFILRRTTLGLSLRTLGESPSVAEYAGIRVRRTMVSAMFVGGALAGLAGSVEVLGTRGRLITGLSNGYGFEAIAVALLGANNPWGIVPAALLFGALDAGATGLRTTARLPAAIVPIAEGLAVMFVLVGLALYRRHLKQQELKKVQEMSRAES